MLTCLLMLLLFGTLLSLLIRVHWTFIAVQGYDETPDLPICDCIKNCSMKGSINFFFLVFHHMAECILSWKIKLQMLLTSVIVCEGLISLCSWRRVIWIRFNFPAAAASTLQYLMRQYVATTKPVFHFYRSTHWGGFVVQTRSNCHSIG